MDPGESPGIHSTDWGEGATSCQTCFRFPVFGPQLLLLRLLLQPCEASRLFVDPQFHDHRSSLAKQASVVSGPWSKGPDSRFPQKKLCRVYPPVSGGIHGETVTQQMDLEGRGFGRTASRWSLPGDIKRTSYIQYNICLAMNGTLVTRSRGSKRTTLARLERRA